MSKRFSALILLGGALLIAMIAGGCGDSEDSSEPAGSGASSNANNNGGGTGNRNESGSSEGGEEQGNGSASGGESGFVKEANEICTERRTEVLARVQSYVEENAGGGKNVTALQAEAVDPLFVPNVETQIEEIGELTPPPGKEAEVEAFLAAMEEGVATTKRKNYTAANVEKLGSEYPKASRLAEELGISACSFGA